MTIQSENLSTSPSEVTRPQIEAGWRWKPYVLFGIMAVVLAVVPSFIYPILVLKVLCFAIFAGAFNLLLGYSGLLSFGHAAFFGLGSYICGYAAKYWGFPPEFAIAFAVAFTALLGLVFGAISIRRSGIYFAMITLALSQMVYFIALQWPAFSGGEDGLQSVPRGRLFGVFNLADDRVLYVFVAVLFLLTYMFLYRIVHSPFGNVLKSIRDNESRATSLGYKADRYKLIAFVLSAGTAGLAGAIKVLVFQVATLSDVHLSMSSEPIMMVLVGGLGTFVGPILGATLIVLMQNFLTPLGAWITVLQGVVFIVCVLALRQGIVGLMLRKGRDD